MLNKVIQIFKIKELRNKIFFILALLVVFRLAANIPIPGVDQERLRDFFQNNEFFGLLNLFSGSGLSSISIVMLGVGPYITASIIMQLMTMALPSMEALQKEGEYGRRKINQYTRYLTVPLALLQAWGMVALLQRSDVSILGSISPLRMVAILLVITGGTMLLMWIGELITEMGIGNGVSLIIFMGILAALPTSLSSTLALFDLGKMMNLIIFVILAIVTIYFVVYISEGQRNIPIAYAGRGGGNRLFSGQTNHLPLRVNQAGVIPIIFALSLLMFPGLIASFFAAARTPWIASAANAVQKLFQDQLFYGILYFVLVVGFTYFYTWVIFKPENVAENIQRSGGFIPGIRPGKQTIDFLSFVSNRITLAGAIFLGLIAVLPLLAQSMTGVTTLTLGGTGLLIVVSVALETMRQVRAQLIMKQYDEI